MGNSLYPYLLEQLNDLLVKLPSTHYFQVDLDYAVLQAFSAVVATFRTLNFNETQPPTPQSTQVDLRLPGLAFVFPRAQISSVSDSTSPSVFLIRVGLVQNPSRWGCAYRIFGVRTLKFTSCWRREISLMNAYVLLLGVSNHQDGLEL